MKSRFAGLASARLQDIEAEGVEPIDEAPAPTSAPKTKTKKKPVKQVNKSTSRKAGKKTFDKDEEFSALVSARTSEDNRSWWIYQARLQKTSLQKAIVEALEKRFGLPKKARTK